MRHRVWIQRVVVGLLVVVAAFQAALALGAPWGAIAWGGANRGVLPASLRAASASAIIVYAAIIGLVLREPFAARVLRALYAGLAALFAVATIANAISRSTPERGWAPVAAMIAIGFALLGRRGESASAAIAR
jgi:hypothetical protein